MENIFHLLPMLEGEELFFIQNLTKDFDNDLLMQFANIYRSRRKDPQLILVLALIGFLGIAGIHRFFIDQIGMGILYLLTGGLCLIGTIVDLVNYKRLAYEFNQMQAQEIAMILRNTAR